MSITSHKLSYFISKYKYLNDLTFINNCTNPVKKKTRLAISRAFNFNPRFHSFPLFIKKIYRVRSSTIKGS